HDRPLLPAHGDGAAWPGGHRRGVRRPGSLGAAGLHCEWDGRLATERPDEPERDDAVLPREPGTVVQTETDDVRHGLASPDRFGAPGNQPVWSSARLESRL